MVFVDCDCGVFFFLESRGEIRFIIEEDIIIGVELNSSDRFSSCDNNLLILCMVWTLVSAERTCL